MAKVLVVDDSLSVRKVVERALMGRQIEVVCAATGSEALERIERDAPDVIVCDVVMPDRDGYEICEFVKRHPRLGRTPVLLMSGIVNDEVRERAARAQCADVLSKPFAAEDLLRKLDALLAAAPRETAPAAVAPALSGTNGHAAHAVEPVAPRTPDPVVPPAPEPLAPRTPAPVAPRPSGPAAPHEAAPPAANKAEPAPAMGSSQALKQFAAIDGVQWAVLADREGFLLDASADGAVDPEVAGALSACLAESSDGLGRELGRGALQGMILEYEQGMVVLYSVGAAALLAIGLGEPSVLGKVRYYAKKTLPELMHTV
jgi:CheY-like chemotaxis protein/predicted regulator of Ras-like GTPase activity (Roadblock/LC7/MglB family)